MKTVEELNQLRTRARNKMEMRLDDGHDYFVVVAMGTVGITSGARNVLLKFVDEVSKQKLPVLVMQDGHIEPTGMEPLVKIVTKDGDETIYANVDANGANIIIDQHLKNGQVVTEYLKKED